LKVIKHGNPQAQQARCDRCETLLGYSLQDIRLTSNAKAFVECPICGQKVYIGKPENLTLQEYLEMTYESTRA
jgi:RNase P subunit RPR2